MRGPATLAQKPCGIRILKAIDGVSEADIVFPLKVWKLIIVVTSSRAIGQNFVEIRVGVMLEERVTQRRITVRGRAQQLRDHRERRKSDALVIHRLVITAVRCHEVCEIENVIEDARACFRSGAARDSTMRLPFDRG